MKLRKLLALLLAMCVVFSVAACAKARSNDTQSPQTQQTETSQTEPSQTTEQTQPTGTEAVESQITPILYKVTDQQGNVAWLFGSIHVGEEYFYPLPEYVNNAYESADALAVEYDIITYESDLSAQMADMRMLVYTDGTTIRDHIPEELYNAAVDILKDYGIYSVMLDIYCPAMWASFVDSILFEQTGMETTLGIDRHLLERAHADGKEVLDVESSQFQMGMLANFSEPLQIMLLESSVASYQYPFAYRVSMKQLAKAWANGNEETLSTLLNQGSEYLSGEEALLYQEYNDAMIVTRNISMADFAEDALKSGKEVFICVGAAHIVGPGAMAQLLQERGYTVEIVK